jgi:spore cortex formation protein SpoVR/YcgB (stage V sporulation)
MEILLPGRGPREPISDGGDWTFELIGRYDREIGAIAEQFGLDTYPNQIEIIRSDQMMDAYASIGMPIGYHHWSFGKHFVDVERSYQRGFMGLAYEIVINSNPCISYLMEENSMTMQALVIAHACYGHNSFFKGNYLFQTWTDASAIVDYLLFARNYIASCEERYGVQEVEMILDSCHALMNYGVDRYKRPYPISAEEEKRRQAERAEYVQRTLNDLWRTLPQARQLDSSDEEVFPRAVLLPSAADPGDERGVGVVLALHPFERALRSRPGHRRLHDGVSRLAHSGSVPAEF